MKGLTLLGYLVVLLNCSTIHADYFTPQELKALPKYCQDKLANKNTSHWTRVFGGNWAHMRHYCGAVAWYSKALTAPLGATGTNGRAFFLTETIGNLNYSIRSATSRAASTPGAATWPLLPKAYYNLAKALEAKGQDNEALKNYLQAIKLKKNFALAYASTSDSFKKIGDIENAKKYIEEGLKHSPNSKSLKRRKNKLDSIK